jgi:hypothetical protein
MKPAPRSNSHVFSLEQAAGVAPSLALLQERIRASHRCLEQVRHMIPAPLRTLVQAGPLDGDEWCLLVGSASASTKLRQLLPTMQRHLCSSGLQVNSIRLKIQTPRPRS